MLKKLLNFLGGVSQGASIAYLLFGLRIKVMDPSLILGDNSTHKFLSHLQRERERQRQRQGERGRRNIEILSLFFFCSLVNILETHLNMLCVLIRITSSSISIVYRRSKTHPSLNYPHLPPDLAL